MHIGIIPDGNRRYMRKKGISNLLESYRGGIDKFYDVFEWCIDLGVKEVTLYALSTENLRNRDKFEIATLLNLFSEHAVSVLDDERIHRNKVRVNICGDAKYIEKLGNPWGKDVVENLKKLENSTKDYGNIILNLAIGYGGRQELINAVKKVVESGLELNEENIKNNLWIKNYPEIIIRTAEGRLSNFLLWQSAYSEIFFIDKLWQEFERDDLARVIQEYNSREKRFGR